MEALENTCPLCDRPLGNRANKHHLVPRSLKGKETVELHTICHNKIHSVFSERELEKYYHTIGRLKEHEEIQKFIKWVSNKAPDFHEKHKHTNALKAKRGKRRRY